MTDRTSSTLRYTNPVYSGYFADPFVFRYEDAYYAVGTGHQESEDDSGMPSVFPMLFSEDFVTWTPLGHALVMPRDADGAPFGDQHWAPEIAFRDGRFYMYYSVGMGDRGHHLRVAVSSRPSGPYRDVGTPLLDPSETPFAIDPNPFQDEDGRWYVFYARDFLDSEGGARPGTALVVAELHEMTRLSPEFHVVARARYDWQRYLADRPMYGGRYDWHTLEGPCAIRREGRIYCLYSGGNWQNETYGLDFVAADRVLGPYDPTGEAPRVMRTVPGRVLGPGHNSLTWGPDGRTPFVAYHAWDLAMTARRLCLDVLSWTPDGPRCLGPTWEPQSIETAS